MINGRVEVKNNLPKKGDVDSALKNTIQKLTLKLARMVKKDFLSGQVLNRRTGNLSRSVTQRFEDGGHVGIVGTALSYAKVHEYGGAINIPGHMRMMKQAFGRPVKNPRQIFVRDHIAKYPERSFLRAALRQIEPEIKPAIEKAILGALK